MGLVLFAFGLAAGVLGAYVAIGFLADSAGLILSVFLAALIVVLVLGVLILALRKTLLKRLFGHAEVALEEIASPLARIADRAIERDPQGRLQRRGTWWRWSRRAIPGSRPGAG